MVPTHSTRSKTDQDLSLYSSWTMMNWLKVDVFRDPTAERILLGLVLHAGSIPPEMRDLSPASFHVDPHPDYWKAILALHQADHQAAIDGARLVAQLNAAPPEPDGYNFDMASTLDYIRGIADLHPDPDQAPYYLRRLLNVDHKRELWTAVVRSLKLLNENAANQTTAASLRSQLRAALDVLDFGTPQTRPPTWADLNRLAAPVEWDWPGWLPRGALVLLAGESGIGKSLLALRLAASYLRGDPWPDACLLTQETGKQLIEGTLAESSQLAAGEPTAEDRPQEHVRLADRESAAILWCESEAAQLLNLRRAQAWGLPCKRIWSPLPGTQDVHLDRPAHRAAISRLAARPQVRLIVVDSLSGASQVPGRSEQSAQAVKWLAELARDTAKPVLLLHHLRKASSSAGAAGARIVRLEDLRGHSSIVQPARVVLALDAPDPARPQLKRLSVIKTNLAAAPSPIGLHIDTDPVSSAPRLRFCDPPQPPQPTSVLQQAIELLRELLSQGPLPAVLIEEKLAKAGISRRTMKRAKLQLSIRSARQNERWIWLLPSNDTDPTLPEPAPAK